MAEILMWLLKKDKDNRQTKERESHFELPIYRNIGIYNAL